MNLRVNGQNHILTECQTLDNAIRHFCKDPDTVICELNGMIIKRQLWVQTTLADNDALELITFVGGG